MKYELIKDTPIIHTILPNEIILELDEWKKKCDLIKNHPLASLMQHENVGTNFNRYQVSVPTFLIDNSFWLAYTMRLCGQMFEVSHRSFYLRKWEGHFDGYDFWINYSYKGNSNPRHNHAGFLSGVIYLNNKNDETVFTDYNISFKGTKGSMIIFPSQAYHKVEEQKEDYERITFAFNINRKNLT
jgi:hypothetical protein